MNGQPVTAPTDDPVRHSAPETVLAQPGGDVVAAQLQPWRLWRQVALTALVALLIAAALGAVVSRQLAEREVTADAVTRGALLGDVVVQPLLRDEMLTGDAATFAALDQAVDLHVLAEGVVRAKIWNAEGRVLYSDEQRLVGSSYPLSPVKVAVLEGRADDFAVPLDPDLPENSFESPELRLLEVYTRVETPEGVPLLFETHIAMSEVNRRFGAVWGGLGLASASSLILVLLLVLPLFWQVRNRMGSAHRRRERALLRAAEVSTAERRRIAASLHDGVVQDLAGAAFVLAGARHQAERAAQPAVVEAMDRASAALRMTIGGLRAVLLEIYPPSLTTTSLESALVDLTSSVTSDRLEVSLELPDEPLGELAGPTQQLVFRVAYECLMNTVQHADARHANLRLAVRGGTIVLNVTDDGIGFDALRPLAREGAGLSGVELMTGSALEAGAWLRVWTAPGHGTEWELRIADR